MTNPTKTVVLPSKKGRPMVRSNVGTWQPEVRDRHKRPDHPPRCAAAACEGLWNPNGRGRACCEGSPFLWFRRDIQNEGHEAGGLRLDPYRLFCLWDPARTSLPVV